ncbi:MULTISPECIES: Fe2+-enterobactin ABC transporter substrate-binding protein [Nocardiopsis]|uniref:Fe2+-enterobactin ABC transporter substrate-binding protein n=1 Tax=Nocardiopsis tropica TaxID=109330 RepID=A0ABV1ZRB2_9ACTN
MKQAPVSATLTTGAAAATLVLLLAGCGAGDTAASPAGEGETRTVTHLYGDTEIPAEPERVVSVSVTSTPLLLSLDVPVVASGVAGTSALTDDKGFFAQWAQTADERGVEPLPGPEVGLEAVAAAEPDLIVGNGFGADTVPEELYEQLSGIAPTVVHGESDTAWLDTTDQYAETFARQDRAEEITAEYEALVEEVSADLDTAHDVVILTGTPNGFNVFTEESAQGRLATDLGLTVHALPDDVAAPGGQGGERGDIVELSAERASDFGDATLLFVNTQGQEIEDYLEVSPTLENIPAWEEDRVFTLGAASFRMDYYSVPMVAERLAEVLGS